jgi:hypothetical protein
MKTIQHLNSDLNISPNLEYKNSLELEAIYDRYAIVMGNLIKEAEEIIKESKKEMLRGHSIILAPPPTEHYENI